MPRAARSSSTHAKRVQHWSAAWIVYVHIESSSHGEEESSLVSGWALVLHTRADAQWVGFVCGMDAGRQTGDACACSALISSRFAPLFVSTFFC